MPVAADGYGRGSAPFRLLLGLVVLSLGVIFLASNLGLLDAHEVLRTFWPAVFVVLGFASLVRPRRTTSRFWGLAWIVAGVWIFAHQRGWIRVDFWDVAFPILLLVFGASLVWRSLGREPRRERRWRRGEAVGDDYLRAVGVFSGNVVRSTSGAFRGAELTAVMGGVTLDLAQARMEGERAVVDLAAVWGGIEIKVPTDWAVASEVTPILGAYEDKTRPTGGPATKQLLVRGVVVMGGVEVTS